jgi:aspartate aminotransferase
MKISRTAFSITASPTLSLNERAKSLRAQGKSVINLGVGEPKNLTPLMAIKAAKARLATRRIKYTPSSGIPELKKAIVQYTKENYSRTPALKNIQVTVGAKQAIYNALVAILNPGDEVIMLAPYWVSYPEMIKMACGIPVVVMPLEAKLTPQMKDVQSAVTSNTKAVILNSPNNPSGVIYSPDFVSEMVVFCEQHEIYLIMDDIYHKLVYGETPWVAGYTFSEKEIDSSYIIVINGISKSFGMTGFRIGWAVASSELIQVMTNIQSQTTSGVSIILQDAAVGALTGYQKVITELRDNIEENRDIALDGLLSINKLKIIKPEGAFYCLPDFRAYNSDSFALSEYILDKALVAVVPGSAFGMEGYLRISYAGDPEEIAEAISRISYLLGK